jgi:hypothetical protein
MPWLRPRDAVFQIASYWRPMVLKEKELSPIAILAPAVNMDYTSPQIIAKLESRRPCLPEKY